MVLRGIMKEDRSMAVRRRRCELSTPAISMKMMQHAAASEADEVFLDLEDSVAPSKKTKEDKTPLKPSILSTGATRPEPSGNQ